MSSQNLLERIATVLDPELDISVCELGMIESVTVEGPVVRVILRPSFIACPSIAVIESQMRKVITSLGYSAEIQWEGRSWQGADVDDSARKKLLGLGIVVRTDQDTRSIECPYCGSSSIQMTNVVGPTACRSSYICKECRTPFEVMRSGSCKLNIAKSKNIIGSVP